MKMKKYIYILLMTLGSIGMYSCENVLSEEVLSWNKEEGCYADLTISMNVPSLNVMSSRSLKSDPKNEGTTWTTWEKFVDGALLYHVTLFVIDGNKKLVAYRDFYTGSSDIKEETDNQGGNGFYETSAVNTSANTGIAVKATFSYQNPLHGSIEKLQPGNYKIIAVANYAPIVASGTEGLLNTTLGLDTEQIYAGLGNVVEDGAAETDITNNNGVGGNFTEMVKALTVDKTTNTEFEGVENVLSENLFKYQLNSGEDRVCKQFPQPLVMIRDVTLTSGENKIEGMLSRTFARVRVEVKNNDKVQYLGVYGFSFKENYASRRTYLFNDIHENATSINTVYTNFALYEETKGTIDVTSEDAVESFRAVNISETKRMPPNTSFPMFDCYILEGKIANAFAFQFWASYWSEGDGGDATPELHITKFYQSEYGDNYESGGRDPYGLLEYNVFIRCETAVKTNAQTESSSEILMKSSSSSYASEGPVTVDNPVGEGNVIELGKTHIDPLYIWTIQLNTTEEEFKNGTALTYGNGVTSSGNNDKPGQGGNSGGGVGFESGSLQNLGSGLYLQAYDGGTNMTPQLGEYPDNTLIFKINLKDMYEVGTIFCLVNNTYYYLQYDSSEGILWKEFSGTVTKDSGEYRYFTWETIGGTAGERTNKEIKKTIDNTSAETATNEIVRNDFFYGIVPISYSEDSARN